MKWPPLKNDEKQEIIKSQQDNYGHHLPEFRLMKKHIRCEKDKLISLNLENENILLYQDHLKLKPFRQQIPLLGVGDHSTYEFRKQRDHFETEIYEVIDKRDDIMDSKQSPET